MTIEATVTLKGKDISSVGRDRIRLLQAVAREGSISAGAKAAGFAGLVLMALSLVIAVGSYFAATGLDNALDQNGIIGRHPELTNFLFANGFSGREPTVLLMIAVQ